MKPGADDTRPAGLDAVIVAYLVLPLLIFCGWFKWPFALVLVLLALAAFRDVFGLARLSSFGVGLRPAALIFAVASIWTALSGVGHFVYANFDWVTRDAVLRDLTRTAWPPAYQTEGELPLILRAPVGYYMPAALLGSWLGLASADFALYLWTVLGFGLFLCAATTLFASTRQRVVCCLMLMAFGGLDLIGFVLFEERLPQLGEHIERWAGFAQYSSDSTLLFWVPNHALPAWLGLVLVLRQWRTATLARLAPMMAAAVPLWSPLSALGLLPFFVFGLNWRRDWRALFSIRSSLPYLALTLIVARYITLNSQSIPSGWALSSFGHWSSFLHDYLLFVVLEFGLLVGVLWRLKAGDARLALSVAILLALPLYRFGQGNDLVMRSSVPALAMICLATVRPLADAPRSAWRYLLVAILAVGALGAAQEPLRALLRPRWAPTGQTLGQVSNPHHASYVDMLPPHYVAELNQPGLTLLLRQPSPVLPDPVAGPEPSAPLPPATSPSRPGP
jgi:hypothetical protein